MIVNPHFLESVTDNFAKLSAEKKQKTYPISRALTSPAIPTAGGAALGGLLGVVATKSVSKPTPKKPSRASALTSAKNIRRMRIGGATGAVVGGALGLGSNVLNRFIAERGRQGRKFTGDQPSYEKGVKTKSRKSIFGTLTSPVFAAATGGVLGALGTKSVGGAIAGAGIGAGGQYAGKNLGRWIESRAKKGRVARGGKGLYSFER